MIELSVALKNQKGKKENKNVMLISHVVKIENIKMPPQDMHTNYPLRQVMILCLHINIMLDRDYQLGHQSKWFILRYCNIV